MDVVNRHEGHSPSQVIDFSIHDIVGLRLIDPSALDAANLVKQLGPYQAPLDGVPDITVRFARELSPPALNYLGLNSMAFTNDEFYLLDSRSGRAVARIPFDEIGQPCEIVYQSGLGRMPLLFDIIRLVFLKKNYVSLHGAAFRYNDQGVLVAGWTKGGKTETLVAFANHGASYVADEWVLLSGDGHRMLGLPVLVALWDWQLEQVAPDLRPEMSREKRTLFRSIHSLDVAYSSFGRGRLQHLFPLKALGKLLPVLKTGLNVQELPQIMFKDRYCAQGVPFDRLFLMMSHSNPDIVVAPYDPIEIARQMVHSNEHEEMEFFQRYRAFKFAFPQRANPFLEGALELGRSLLCSALQGKEAYRVLHPYPVSFEELFSHLQPLC
jgi:hypothetical protein